MVSVANTLQSLHSGLLVSYDIYIYIIYPSNDQGHMSLTLLMTGSSVVVTVWKMRSQDWRGSGVLRDIFFSLATS